MTDVFLKLLNMSFTASILIIVVLILRMLLKKAPKWMTCLLWGLVAVRLICPVSPESVLSLVPNANPIPANIEYMAEPQIESGIPVIDNAVNPIMIESFAPPEHVTSVNPLQIWLFIAAVVWIIGLLVMMLYGGISYLMLYRKVRASIPVEGRILLQENDFEAEGKSFRSGKRIYLCDDIDMPFILGIIRPRIYLPSGMDETAVKYVIAHEKAHLKRRDHLWKPFGFLVLSIHWFNPLVWVAYIMLGRDIELACDEKVVRDLSLEDKKEYSMALLTCSTSRRMIAACPLAFGEVGVRERIKSVLKYKKPSFWAIVVVCFLLLCVTVFFMTNPVSQKKASSQPERTMGAEQPAETDRTVETKQPGETEQPLGAEQIDIVEQQLEEQLKNLEYDKVILGKYIDLSRMSVPDEAHVPEAFFEDRYFLCEQAYINELEKMVHDLYYYDMAGESDARYNLVEGNESLKIAIRNEEKQAAEGIYMSEYRLHGFHTLTAEDVHALPELAKDDICNDIELYGLSEFAIVRVDVSWQYSEKAYSLGPQLDNGRYIRYYLLGAADTPSEYKIYELYWGEYWGDRVPSV